MKRWLNDYWPLPVFAIFMALPLGAWLLEPSCIRTARQMVHHPDVTIYIKFGNILVPSTTPAYDSVEDVCVEWEASE